MNPNFKKLTLAASVSAALGAAAMPTHAMLVGEAGEALLIPWVTHDRGLVGFQGKKNTYISVVTPANVGFDTVPATYTAPNTTPTDPGLNLGVVDPDLQNANAAIHWYWFDNLSVHRRNDKIPVTPNDQVWIDWEAASRGGYAGVDGYMVIGNESARFGGDATFAMFGEAWVEMYNSEFDPMGSMVQIPVLPMIDSADGDDPNPTVTDNVKYTGGIPSGVAPLYSGIRMNGAVAGQYSVFNLSLGDRNFPSVHVVWLDRNGTNNVTVEVYDSNEQSCSDNIDLPHEVNVISIAPWSEPFVPGGQYELCLPDSYDTTVRNDGFVQYQIPQPTVSDLPVAAGVAFSITMDYGSGKTNDDIRFTSAPAMVRGLYNN